MSQIKTLREDPSNCINLADILQESFKGKTKYTDLFLRLIKDQKNNTENENMNGIKDWLVNYGRFSLDKLSKMSSLEVLLIYYFFSNTIDDYTRENMFEFIDFNERKLIEQNDLSKYKTFLDIIPQVSLAKLRLQNKDLEKQIHVIHEDDEYLIMRPLSLQSSKKYGANTKWCTTMDDTHYFQKYYQRGILIYVINKKTGDKVGIYKSKYEHDCEFSFWDVLDNRIDSLESGLPYTILDLIVKEIDDNPKTNRELLTNEQIEKYEGYQYQIKIPHELRSIEDPGYSTEEDEIGVMEIDEEIEVSDDVEVNEHMTVRRYNYLARRVSNNETGFTDETTGEKFPY